MSSIPLGPEFFCRRLSDQHYYRGEVGERKEKSENMPVQNYNEDLTELMKKTPTMSWVLEGDKGKTCNRIYMNFHLYQASAHNQCLRLCEFKHRVGPRGHKELHEAS